MSTARCDAAFIAFDVSRRWRAGGKPVPSTPSTRRRLQSVATSLTPSTQVPYFFLDYSLPTKRAYAFHLGLAAILTVYFLGFSVLLERMASLGVPWRFAVHAAVCYSNMRLRAPKAYLDIEKKRAEKSS